MNKDYINALLNSAHTGDDSEEKKAERIREQAEAWLDRLFEDYPLRREPI